jgi:hypothetical protein
MKKIINVVAILCACAMIGCGSSAKVVVDEDAIREQTAKVESEERAHQEQEAKIARKQAAPQPTASSVDSGAEGSN